MPSFFSSSFFSTGGGGAAGSLTVFTQSVIVYDGQGSTITDAEIGVRVVEVPDELAGSIFNNASDEYITGVGGEAVLTLVDGVTYVIHAGHGRSKRFTADSTASTGGVPPLVAA